MSLTHKEAMLALLDGKKLRNKEWGQNEYVYLYQGLLIDDNADDANCTFSLSNSYEIYKPEPKKKTVTLHRYTVEEPDGRIRQLDWTNEATCQRVNNPMFKILKTETKTIEVMI